MNDLRDWRAVVKHRAGSRCPSNRPMKSSAVRARSSRNKSRAQSRKRGRSKKPHDKQDANGHSMHLRPRDCPRTIAKAQGACPRARHAIDLLADPQTGVAPGWTRGRHMRSRCRCSMCSAIHINCIYVNRLCSLYYVLYYGIFEFVLAQCLIIFLN